MNKERLIEVGTLTGEDLDLIIGIFSKDSKTPTQLLRVPLGEIKEKILEEDTRLKEYKEELIDSIRGLNSSKAKIDKIYEIKPSMPEKFTLLALRCLMTMVEWAVRRGYLQHLTDNQLWGNKELAKEFSKVGIKLEKELEDVNDKVAKLHTIFQEVERAEKTRKW